MPALVAGIRPVMKVTRPPRLAASVPLYDVRSSASTHWLGGIRSTQRASRVHQMCIRPQCGQCAWPNASGSFLKLPSSILMPVENSRPLIGQFNISTPMACAPLINEVCPNLRTTESRLFTFLRHDLLMEIPQAPWSPCRNAALTAGTNLHSSSKSHGVEKSAEGDAIAANSLLQPGDADMSCNNRPGNLNMWAGDRCRARPALLL
jgi:hypothetical protein